MYHDPVLLNESIAFLQLKPESLVVDVTFGGGGHSAAILKELGDKGRLFAFDQDADARKNAEQAPFQGAENFHFIQSNFRHLKRQLRALGIVPGSIDGLLADLGVSSYQFDTPDRGFSYRFDAPLDMRMDAEGEGGADFVLNTYSADSLQNILSIYGEVRNARTLAQAIVKQRDQHPFKTTGDLVAICDTWYMGDRLRYLSQVFQALRMEVNEEVSVLEDLLREAMEVLKPGGRLVVISYHSIEDRLVKNFLKSGNAQGELDKDFYGNIHRPFKLITKKAVTASEEEIKRNPRARSAKLRTGEKT
ncbi:MAG: 16S rRNA (cytosine(1402)-N(4))-methyltransferase RsmH [Saprospiraceae bacterium]